MDKFWLIGDEAGKTKACIYNTLEEAKNTSQDLAAKFPGEVLFVYEAVYKVKCVPQVITIDEALMDPIRRAPNA